ncbi:hypothetical protein [Morganella morganii IS15]|nr:putative membrane protein [Morganella morganii]EMP51896.1 hypothetical protein C790_00795 [Morganella morganii SC01]CDK64190.1 hypothetical protein [Morganella morganii IS15]
MDNQANKFLIFIYFNVHNYYFLLLVLPKIFFVMRKNET